jgi:hypothetical protein
MYRRVTWRVGPPLGKPVRLPVEVPVIPRSQSASEDPCDNEACLQQTMRNQCRAIE